LLDWPEILLRLGVATLAGGLIGLNRDLQDKPIGLKTLGLVGLATAMVVVLADPSPDHAKITDAGSRIIQGILTTSAFSAQASLSTPSIIFGCAGSPAPHAPGLPRALASPAVSDNGGLSGPRS
jgi:hypothetical protein